MSTAQSAIDKDSDLAIAWDAYKASDAYASSKHWALRISPMVQSGRAAGAPRQGPLWAAFMAEWNAAGGKL